MTTRPETRYARSGETSIALRVLGEGPIDLVLVPGIVSHVEFQGRAGRVAAPRRGRMTRQRREGR